MNNHIHNKTTLIFILIIFLCYLLVSITSYRQKSATVDEGIIIASGYFFLKHGENIVNPENPVLLKSILASPLLSLNITAPVLPKDLPNTYENHLEFSYAEKFLFSNDALSILFRCRAINVLLNFISGIFIFLIIKSFTGKKWAVLGMALYLFAPNILAHARLATVDIGITMFIIGTSYFLMKAIEENKTLWITCAGLMAGGALVSKYTGLLIIPIVITQCLLYLKFNYSKKNLRKILRILCFILLIILLTINSLYFFQGTGRCLNDYEFRSGVLTGLTNLPILAQIPVPLPGQYLKGFDIVSYFNSCDFPTVFAGKFYPKGGSWWYYYFLTAVLKVPIPLLIISITGLGYLTIKFGKFWKYSFYVVPPLIIFFNFSFIAQRQLGLRYILPVFPFMIIAAVIGIRIFFKRKQTFYTILAYALLGWFVFETISIYPHYLSYCNQFAGGPENGRKWFAASNLDWGQDLPGVKKWLLNHKMPAFRLLYYGEGNPQYYGIKQTRIPRFIGISVTNMYLFHNDDFVKTLLTFEPVARIGNTIYIYGPWTTHPLSERNN